MVHVEVKTTRDSVGLSLRDWNDLLRAAWLHAIRFWFRFILPKHFTHRGATEYKYKPRDIKYNRRKLRKFGHTYPNVFSGKMRAEALANVTDIRVTQAGGKAYIHGPKYLFKYRKYGGRKAARYLRRRSHHAGTDPARYVLHDQPDKAAELTAVSKADMELIAKIMDRFIQRAVGSAGGMRDLTAGHRVSA